MNAPMVTRLALVTRQHRGSCRRHEHTNVASHRWYGPYGWAGTYRRTNTRLKPPTNDPPPRTRWLMTI